MARAAQESAPHPSSGGAARRFVADVLLTRDLSEDCIERAVLVTGEILTDDIVRTATDVALVVADLPMVRVEVRDLETATCDHTVPATTSYGLQLVEALF